MSGKFMRVKRLVIPVITLVMIASQLSGCASTSKKELVNMVNNNQEIVLEVESPEYEMQGEREELYWTQLSLKTSNVNTRKIVDSYFDNYTNSQGIKYGPFYVDKDNNQEGNNTLFNVLGNEYVANTLSENTDTMMKEVSQYLNKDYADLEESDYTSAMFNGYFELIPDSTPNYFNGGASLSRAEAMALVMRAVTPVGTPEQDADFENAVSGTSYDLYTPYASKENSKVYISTADGSLNADNFAGMMTRGEYIYLVMNEIYGTEQTATADTSEVSLSDCKSNTKIADTLKLTSTSNQFHSACLQYALQNADKGVPDELYKAIVMAYEKGIIGSETRWDEAITKTEAIEILIATMQTYYKENGYPYNNAEGGTTTALETAGKALWEKQDKNDMSCTEEEFIEDYVTAISKGITEEAFIETITVEYSIKFAEEQAEKNKQEYINNLWLLYGEDKLACDKETFTSEYESYAEEKGDSYDETEFATYINDKYAKEKDKQQEETTDSNTEQDEQHETNDDTSNGNNSSSGNNSSNETSGNSNNNNSNTYEEPVYTPPADNSNSGNTYEEPVYTPPVEQTPAQQEPAYQEPVYTPPVDNGNSSSGNNTGWGGDDLSAFGGGNGWDKDLDDAINNAYN